LLFGYDWVSVQLGRPANACSWLSTALSKTSFSI
jgi:hypothetical protein